MKHARHPATIIAAVALFMALGGGAYAAAQTLISGSKIKNHTIAEKKLTNSAIAALKGQKGDPGQPGPSNGYSVLNSNFVNLDSNGETIATLAVPAGSYIVFANTTVTNTTVSENTGCYLTAPDSSNIDTGYISTSTTGGYPTQTSVGLTGPLTTTGGNITVVCYTDDTSGSGFAYPSRISAIKVGTLTGAAKRINGHRTPTAVPSG